jgi:hypothetical protein
MPRAVQAVKDAVERWLDESDFDAPFPLVRHWMVACGIGENSVHQAFRELRTEGKLTGGDWGNGYRRPGTPPNTRARVQAVFRDQVAAGIRTPGAPIDVGAFAAELGVTRDSVYVALREMRGTGEVAGGGHKTTPFRVGLPVPAASDNPEQTPNTRMSAV